MPSTQTLIILLTSHIAFFLLGYILGRLNKVLSLLNPERQQASFQNTLKSVTAAKMASIKIDDAKYVTEVKTSELEKKFSSLGTTISSQDNITAARAKLAALKKKTGD